MSQIGEYLKAKRRKLGLSVRKAAERAEVSNAYLSMIESGKRDAPHPNILRKLAPVYEEDVGTLMKVAGYLEPDFGEPEAYEVERLFNEAMADPDVGIGHRLRGELDFNAKKAIAEMYKRVKQMHKKD
jgi:transcriptional regulator with XRE-family HTH domain